MCGIFLIFSKNGQFSDQISDLVMKNFNLLSNRTIVLINQLIPCLPPLLLSASVFFSSSPRPLINLCINFNLCSLALSG